VARGITATPIIGGVLPDSVPAFEVYYDTKALWSAAGVERLEVIMASANSDT
jgi:hypothetical protein